LLGWLTNAQAGGARTLTFTMPRWLSGDHRRTQPLGVLHDLLAPHQDQQQQKQQQQQQPGPGVPWCLHVHYRNQPASLASAWQNSGTAQAHFLSSMKASGAMAWVWICA
jgi:hypothetical protein